MKRGLRKSDWVKSLVTSEFGIIENIDRHTKSREIIPMGVRVDWKSIPKDTGVTTFQYEWDLIRIKRPKN